MVFPKYLIGLTLLLIPGVSIASPGSCYGFFTTLYGEQIPDAQDQDNPGSLIALSNLRDRYQDNRPALEYLHEKRESTRFENEVSKGREMAQGFLPRLQNPTPDTRQRLENSRVYCLGLLEEARKQQRDDTFTATMEGIEKGTVYGKDECSPVDQEKVLANQWLALVGTRVYRLDLTTTGDGWQGVLALNSDGQYQDLARLDGDVSGSVLLMSNAGDDRNLDLQLTRNSECEVGLSGYMSWNNGDDTADVRFWLPD